MAKPSTIRELEEYLRKHEGEYGVKRLQRAADEIPNLEKMYTLQALKEAFGGDNARALMTMNPADFEKYALPLWQRSTSSYSGKKPQSTDKTSMPTSEYVKHLSRVRGFDDVPYLQVLKEEVGLPLHPFVSGHEGRHRNRALASKGIQKALVRMEPRADLREGLPRKYREDYIDALRNDLKYTNNMVRPETDFGQKRDLIQLPDVYAEGGKVDELKEEFMRLAQGGSTIPEDVKAKLDQLKQEFTQLAERDRRAAQATWNAEQMAKPIGKKKGGNVSTAGMRYALTIKQGKKHG